MNIYQDSIIFETDMLLVKRAGTPHVSRSDGGHVQILTKRDIPERRDMTPAESVECAWLTDIVGEAFETAMNKQGIEVVKINYQDNGNWAFFDSEPKPRFHIHIYGRVWGKPANQGFPDALFLPPKGDPYYAQTERLTNDDMRAIREEILRIIDLPKYANKCAWKLA